MYETMSLSEIKKRLKLGKMVRVRWDDVGASDCILVEKVTDPPINSHSRFEGYFFDNEKVSSFTVDQIIDIGKKIKPQFV